MRSPNYAALIVVAGMIFIIFIFIKTLKKAGCGTKLFVVLLLAIIFITTVSKCG